MFATTKALAFQRSAELARSVKNLFLRPEEFETFACVFCQTPSPVRVLPLIQEGEFFSLLFNMLLKLLLLDKRRWPSGRRSLNFCLCVQSNSLPLRVLPLIQEGELFSLLFNLLLKLLLLDKRRWPSGWRSLKLLLACSVKLPSPFGLKP